MIQHKAKDMNDTYDDPPKSSSYASPYAATAPTSQDEDHPSTSRELAHSHSAPCTPSIFQTDHPTNVTSRK